MKKILFAVIAAVVILIILILIGIKVFNAPSPSGNTQKPAPTPASFPQVSPSSATVEQTPVTLATGFYTWYLRGLYANPRFSTSPEFTTNASQWLTTSLLSRWSGIIESTEADPVLLTQDYQDSWLTDIHASVISQTATDSSVAVSLGSDTQLHKLTLHLVPVNGAWRIDSVTAAQ